MDERLVLVYLRALCRGTNAHVPCWRPPLHGRGTSPPRSPQALDFTSLHTETLCLVSRVGRPPASLVIPWQLLVLPGSIAWVSRIRGVRFRRQDRPPVRWARMNGESVQKRGVPVVPHPVYLSSSWGFLGFVGVGVLSVVCCQHLSISVPRMRLALWAGCPVRPAPRHHLNIVD